MVMPLVDRVYCQPFVWGRSDCCTRACDVFAALTGIDPMAPLRGRYRSALGAARLIRRMGGWQAMAQAMAQRAGLAEGVQAGPALGLVRRGDGFALALRVPRGWAAPVDCGAVIVPQAVRFWGLADG